MMQAKERKSNQTNLDYSKELKVNFIANAGVKDIVGKGLIYNDNIAIIELIKNSKDAQSPKVKLEFFDIINQKDSLISEITSPKIIIKDFGVGMSKEDISEKWLNIAYSEKKNARNKVYAGNKGVGRFSCDRLGTQLELYTKSKSDDYLKLYIDWKRFENKGKDDVISSIPLSIEILDESTFLKSIGEDKFEQGTVLVISHLRSNWDERKLKTLISEIEKFSPTLDESFKVYFSSNTTFKDKSLNRINNKNINNNILNKLSFKTTYIKSNISKDGEKLYTTLYFQGEKVYSYTAKNPYSLLKNISLEIHYLDSLSKSYFTRSFGIKPNSYGSIFLFYNSFRISPYGNEKNDWLGLDQRKSQGTSRNFGTRDIIGRIDIEDDNDVFSVITSREGLAHNQAYYDLVAYDPEGKVRLSNGSYEYGYVTTIIRQLESFVVRGTDWNRLEDKLGKQLVVSADDIIRDPDRFRVKQLSLESVANETARLKKSSFDILDLVINESVISRIESINYEKYKKFLDDFINKTQDKSISELSLKEKGFVKKLIESSNKKISEANIKREKAEDTAKLAQDNLKIEKKKQAYLLATRRTLSPDADGLIHTIKINNIEIKEGIDSIIESLEYDELTKEELIDRLGAINLYAVKSLKMAEIATRSGFDKEIDIRSIDIIQYVKEYLDIYSSSFGSNGLSFRLSGDDLEFFKSISVLNFSIVLDNLLSNASKWAADEILIDFVKNEDQLTLSISDNGLGISDLFLSSPDEIFNLGVRDEPPEGLSGSGIGLHYSRELLQEMNASIEFVGNGIYLSGACFRINFK
ncbi:sensor histidine kinase [Vibrio parahaemolyticus]